MTTPVIIGITGKMRSGKSTLANVLAYNNNSTVLSFAQYVRKEVAEAFFGHTTDPHAHLMAQEAADKGTIRPILQAFGHGKRVLISKDYWVEQLSKDVRKNFSDKKVIFIDDVRYPNEVEYIIKNGGFIVRLVCDTQTLLRRGASEAALEHPSENALDPDNLTIAESMLPHHTLALDSSLSDQEALQRWTTDWLLNNQVEIKKVE